MEKMLAVAVFPKIPAENLEDFQQIAHEMLSSIRKLDSVIRYDVFFSDDMTRCIVIEEYLNPAGVFEHVQRHTSYLEKLTKLGGVIEGQMFPYSNEGNELQQIRENWDSQVHTFFDGK